MPGPLSTLLIGDPTYGGGAFRKTARPNPNYNPSDPSSSPYLDDTLTGRQGNARFQEGAAMEKLRALQAMELAKLGESGAINRIKETGTQNRLSSSQDQNFIRDEDIRKYAREEEEKMKALRRLGNADLGSMDPAVRGMARSNLPILNAEADFNAAAPYRDINANSQAQRGMLSNDLLTAETNAKRFVPIGAGGSVKLGSDGNINAIANPAATKVTQGMGEHKYKFGDKEMTMPVQTQSVEQFPARILPVLSPEAIAKARAMSDANGQQAPLVQPQSDKVGFGTVLRTVGEELAPYAQPQRNPINDAKLIKPIINQQSVDDLKMQEMLKQYLKKQQSGRRINNSLTY